MADDLISRRTLVVAAGVAGLGVAATQARAVTDPQRSFLARARLLGNLDPTGTRFDWFDGQVMAVAVTGSVTPLMSVRGHWQTRLTPVNADTWRAQRKLFATYYDTKSGKTLSAFHNPLTGAEVKVSHIEGAVAESVLDANTAGQWRQAGTNFELQHTAAADFGALRGLSVTTHTGPIADLQNPLLTTLPDSGSWTLITAWLTWLAMGNTPGHCVFQCTRAGGPALPATV